MALLENVPFDAIQSHTCSEQSMILTLGMGKKWKDAHLDYIAHISPNYINEVRQIRTNRCLCFFFNSRCVACHVAGLSSSFTKNESTSCKRGDVSPTAAQSWSTQLGELKNNKESEKPVRSRNTYFTPCSHLFHPVLSDPLAKHPTTRDPARWCPAAPCAWHVAPCRRGGFHGGGGT